MGWADGYVKVNDGQLCMVEPLREHSLEVGDIVLCPGIAALK